MAWITGWRQALWDELTSARESWDVIVVGGGILGAGVFREASRRGLKVLLLEARDFASGTSSRSSKVVHGGVRYLTQGQWRVTRAAVHERDRLVREAPGLVEPMRFIRTLDRSERSRRWLYNACFTAYDALARRRTHERLDAAEVGRLLPHVGTERLIGGIRYVEARTDDARLVLRLLHEGVRRGGRALSYAPADGLLVADGRTAVVRVRDAASRQTAELRAAVVVNATGSDADILRRAVGGRALIRRQRGSHLVIFGSRFPLSQGVAWRHPEDGRSVFALPWEGSTVVGTTDVGHGEVAGIQPTTSAAEFAYLLAGVHANFPSLGIARSDVVATWAGVRPIVAGRGGGDLSSASRESVIVEERGLITVAGGKLTTFHADALRVIEMVRDRCPGMRAPDGVRAFDDVPASDGVLDALDPATRARLLGRYAADAKELVAAACIGELAAVGDTPTLWAEVRWAARAEGVMHLDDLMLRRVRLGLLLPDGGSALLPNIRRICQPELGWSDARWDREAADYQAGWRESHGVPPS